mmetsp:Transcript_5824/g.16640  ORF Transcript_5824/g.16640 Transcript_5824/m.16640 type:complete len:662 (+) Transcript_5824:421-2406(+)
MAPAYILREKRQQRRIVIVRTAITLSALLGACYLLQHPRNERSPQLRFSSFRIVPEHAAATDIGGGGSNLSAGVSGAIARSQSITAKRRSKKGCLPTTWTGNVADYKLTRDAIQCAVDNNNVVIVTWANWHYYDFVSNWVWHLRKLGVVHFLVGSMDDTLLEALSADGVPTFSMASGLTTGDFGWGSKTFHKMGREKIGLIASFTSMGFSILVSDVDTVWMRDPLPYMAQYPQADCLTSSDLLADTARDEGLEHLNSSPANIGIMLFRSSAAEFAQKWMDVLLADDLVWDQNAFNELMYEGRVETPLREDRLFLGTNGTYKFGILPVSMFCSGHTYFVQHMPHKLGLDPYVAHATFQYEETPGKRHRFREALLWNDPPEYFGGHFLAFHPDVPTEMLKAAVPPEDGRTMTMEEVEHQMTLIHHQLVQVRSAWAIAQTLNRTLVLPEMWSGVDRYWSSLLAGRLPGSRTDLPFQAPADHFLALSRILDGDHPEDHFGPQLPHGAIREHSFLRNPRLPPAIKRSRLLVAVCHADRTGPDIACADASGPAQDTNGKLWLSSGLSDKQLRTALGPYRDTRLLVFNTMQDAFGGFVSEDGSLDRFYNSTDVGIKFQRRLSLYTGVFCCTNDQPGHAHYDFFFDVPHTDKLNRAFEDPPWKLTLGDA